AVAPPCGYGKAEALQRPLRGAKHVDLSHVLGGHYATPSCLGKLPRTICTRPGISHVPTSRFPESFRPVLLTGPGRSPPTAANPAKLAAIVESLDFTSLMVSFRPTSL